MRIAMVSEHASPLAVLGGVDAGGQNVHVAALATELGRRGHDVVVHTRRDDPVPRRAVPFAPGVVVDHVPAGPPEPISKDELPPFMPDFADDLARAWRARPPDVVHAHFWMSGQAGLAAAGPLGIPVVHTFHALGVVKRRHQGARDTSPPQRIGVERAVARDARLILATCSDEVFELARLGADVGRIRVVPCGVDLGLFRPDGPTEPRTPGLARLVVLTRLVERKGVGEVLAALAELPDAELVVGGGPERARLWEDPEALRLRALAERLGVLERVDFRGRVERAHVPALLRSADVALCVPWYEPFGIVPLEAMACGIPVVASTVGGLVDSVVHGVTGLHVAPREPRLVAAAVRRLLDDPGLRSALGAAGAERARTRFGWERVADATLDAYRAVAARPLVALPGLAR